MSSFLGTGHVRLIFNVVAHYKYMPSVASLYAEIGGLIP